MGECCLRQNKSESEVAAAVAKALEQQKALKAKGGPEQERAIADYRREGSVATAAASMERVDNRLSAVASHPYAVYPDYRGGAAMQAAQADYRR